MKKLLPFFFLIYTSFYGQVNYPNAKQDLKEFIAIQSLLAENRINDAKNFLLNNNYIAGNDMFMKFDDYLNNDDIISLISIKNGGKNEYADNYLEILFAKKKWKNNYEINFSLEECNSIKIIIQNLCEPGIPYNLLIKMDDLEKKSKNFMHLEKIDRYHYKLYSEDNNPKYTQYYNASNFLRLGTLDKNKKDNIGFFGPGKALMTELLFLKPTESKEEEGKYIMKLQIASIKSEDSSENENFNINFFMGLKDFNDRIWQDK